MSGFWICQGYTLGAQTFASRNFREIKKSRNFETFANSNFWDEFGVKIFREWQQFYTQTVEEREMGELVFNFVMTLPPMVNIPVLPTLKKRKKKATTTNATTRNRDICEMFSGSKRSKKTQPVIDNQIRWKRLNHEKEVFLPILYLCAL